LLIENYVLNANILVFMLIHTELFSNVSGLGLIHCGLGLGLKKFFGPASLSVASASLFLASALASCPAGLVNITAQDILKSATSLAVVLHRLNYYLFLH